MSTLEGAGDRVGGADSFEETHEWRVVCELVPFVTSMSWSVILCR
jgi:hypothetical protein